MLANGGYANDQASLSDATAVPLQHPVASGHEDDSDNESVCSLRSTAAYSVAELMAPASFKSVKFISGIKERTQGTFSNTQVSNTCRKRV